MEINSSGALISGAVSGLVSFGAAFIAQRKLNAFVEGKVQQLLLNAACISAALGLMGVLNELLAFVLLGLQVRDEKITSSLLIYVATFPGVLGLAIWLLKSRSKKPLVNSDEKRVEQAGAVVHGKSTQNTNQGLNTKNILLIGAVAILVAIASQLSDFVGSFSKDKTFNLADCQICDKSGVCKPTDLFTGFKVDTLDVVIFGRIDGRETFYSATPKNEKCTIVKDRNFGFACNDFTDLGFGYFNSQRHEFDGKNHFQVISQTKAVLGGTPINSYSTVSCKVK